MPNSESLYLGVDGGASNITMAVVDQSAKVLAQQLVTGGANYHALGLDPAIEHLESALRDLIEQLPVVAPVAFERAVFGLAGCNFASDRETLTQALRKSSMSTMLGGGFEVVNDAKVALRSGTKDGVGIALIAGTGSNCYGHTADGREGKAGGLDHILSDEGSGYDIGLRGLQSVVAQLDGRGEATKITPQVFTKLGVNSLEGLYTEIYDSYTTKSKIASFAIIVAECAEQGDVVARDILNHSVNELVRLVDAVVKQLSWENERVPVVMVGSVLHQKYVAERLRTELKRLAPDLSLVSPDVPAAVGAAWMAMESVD